MQAKHELKAIVKQLTDLGRTVRFLERRAEAADLPVADYLRHMSKCETVEEKYCLKPGAQCLE